MKKESTWLVNVYVDPRSCCCLLSALAYEEQIGRKIILGLRIEYPKIYVINRESHTLGISRQIIISSHPQECKLESVVLEEKAP